MCACNVHVAITYFELQAHKVCQQTIFENNKSTQLCTTYVCIICIYKEQTNKPH